MRHPFFSVCLLLSFATLVLAQDDEPSDVNLAEMTPQEFFALLDFGDSYVEYFREGEPLDETQHVSIVRGLTRIRRLQPHRVTRWLHLETPWDRLIESPDEHRLEIYLLTGRVQAIQQHKIDPELVDRVGLSSYFQLAVELNADISRPGTIFVEHIPQAWVPFLDQPNQWKDQSFSCPALFLKAPEGNAEKEGFVFAATKLSWHPDQIDSAFGVDLPEVVLARQGMDISEFENVRDRAKLLVQERQAFYQTLASASHISDEDWNDLADTKLGPLLTNQQGLMTQPEDYRANVFQIQGNCRRVTRIEIDDADIQQRIGLDHYFEISVFVPISKPIVSQKSGDESTRKEFRNTFPVMICATQLPEGLEVGEVNQNIEATAIFFKLWAYRSPFMSDKDATRRQISPLLITNRVEISRSQGLPGTGEFGMAVAILLLLVTGLGIGFGFTLTKKRKTRSSS